MSNPPSLDSQQDQEKSVVQDLNIKKTCDKILSVKHWEFIIFIANPILILTTPYLNFNSCSFSIKLVDCLKKKCNFLNISEKCGKNCKDIMRYVQLTIYFFASCGSCYVIYLSGVILINPKEDERFRLITLMIIFLILYIFEFNLKIWYRNEELRRLIQECYFVTNLKIRSVENLTKNWLGLISLYCVFLLSYIIGFCLTAEFVKKNDPLISSPRYRYEIWLPLYILLIFSVMFYICLCWMIFSRFKNLNSTIREYIASQKNDDESKKAERSTKQTGEQSLKSEISEEKRGILRYIASKLLK
jgi:hypothetical protein